MRRRGSGEIAEKILDVFSKFPEKKLSIQDLSKEASVNWDSTKRYLDFFISIGTVKKITDSEKEFYQQIRKIRSDTLFSIPLSEDQRKIITSIYASIKKIWPTITDSKLNRTTIQKIGVDVVEDRFPNDKIPIAWYLFGEMFLLPYQDGAEYEEQISDDETIACIRKISKEYSEFVSTSQIRKHQYEKKKKKTYLLKEEIQDIILQKNIGENKNKLRELLNAFIVSIERTKNNSRCLAIVDDYCSTTLSILRKGDSLQLAKAKPVIIQGFDATWKLIAIHELFESLKKYYDPEILLEYLEDKMLELEFIAIETIEALAEFDEALEVSPSDSLKSLRGSAKELTAEEKKKREEEIKSADKSNVFRKFGLD